ncbi:hypothetical protein NDI47_00145 [Microcoleus vaginatus GB1-A2]|uniref:hypothetical protein n=1 Tax=Microcoleus vaginatus TaxID=119532 RepID=UPI001683D555|nr:hypothetical protein [Microcoleus sp. FACHB-61]
MVALFLFPGRVWEYISRGCVTGKSTCGCPEPRSGTDRGEPTDKTLIILRLKQRYVDLGRSRSVTFF